MTLNPHPNGIPFIRFRDIRQPSSHLWTLKGLASQQFPLRYKMFGRQLLLVLMVVHQAFNFFCFLNTNSPNGSLFLKTKTNDLSTLRVFSQGVGVIISFSVPNH